MLRLQLLGGFRAFTDAGELSVLGNQPRRAAVLAYLAVERDVARETVIAMFWPEVDGERGRHSLNQSIYSLRRLVGADWIAIEGDRCVLSPSVTTDVQELVEASEAGIPEEVLRLYEGPFLASSSISATVDFDLWRDRRRATIDRLHRRARREQLAALTAAGRDRDALACAEEWCRLDPLEDEAQHRCMELLAAAGQRGAALRRFEAYRRQLDEHGLQPLDETLLLLERLKSGDVGPLPPPPPVAPNPRRRRSDREGGVGSSEEVRVGRLGGLFTSVLESKFGLFLLLTGVFLINWMQTGFDNWLADRLAIVGALRVSLARAAGSFEGSLAFAGHELVSRAEIIGYSTAYFLLFPLLLSVVGIALARRSGIRPYRVFSLALTFAYLLSLPFFLAFPVPERWWLPESGAVLLSDLWSPILIDVFRPFSGLDNSFPSAHVSLTVVFVTSAFLFQLRFRWSLAFLGMMIVLSTFALGIHWVADIIAGVSAGILAVALAHRVDRSLPAFADLGDHPEEAAV